MACGDESVAADDGEQPAPDVVCGDGTISGDEVCDEGDANGTVGHCLADCSHMPNRVSISGDVMAFLTEVRGPRIEGATVTVLEHPEMTVNAGPRRTSISTASSRARTSRSWSSTPI